MVGDATGAVTPPLGFALHTSAPPSSDVPSCPSPPAAGMPGVRGHVSVRARQLNARFAAGLEVLGVPYGQHHGYTLGGLRAGGITAFFEETQDIGLTRWRGRWDSMRSLEHYVQELASNEAFARIDPTSRAKIFRLAELLPVVLLDA